MRKNYFTKTRNAILAFVAMVMLCAAPSQLNAQQMLNESFSYPVGDLYGTGEWVKYGSNPEAAVQIVASPLTFAGYQDAAVGNAVALKNASLAQDVQKKFTSGDDNITSGKVYYSALINVKAGSPDKVYCMALIPKTATTNVSDGKGGTEYGRLFILSASEGKFQVGVTRAGATPVMDATEYDLETTYLIVVKYEFIDGVSNDEVSVFVNPADLTKEPETPSAKYATGNDGEVSTKNGIQGIELRQGGSSSKAAADFIIDELRVARSYTELFGGEAPAPDPAITLSSKSLMWGDVFVGETYTKTINVKGSNLKGDITISGMTTGEITASATTLAKDDVESSTGADVVFTFNPMNAELYTDNILIDSEGLKQTTIASYWSVIALVNVADIKTLSLKKKEDYENYHYTGEAVITHIYKEGTKTTFYVQDATGAMPIYDGFGDVKVTYNVGDKITGFNGTVEPIVGLNSVLVIGDKLGTVVSPANIVEPTVVTLTALAAAPANYSARLIKIENVTFKGVAADAVFDEAEVSPAINDGAADGRMKLFKGTDITGTIIPTEAVALVGISTSAAAAVIAPRNLSDIIKAEAGEPSLEILPATVTTQVGHLNVANVFAKFTIKANNLPGSVALDITGANRNMFTVSVSEIKAGTSTTEVIVTYTPTAIAKHTGRLNFECTGASVLNQAITLNAVCIDPANLPTVTLNPTTLPAFAAKVGETQVQTVAVTTANLPDFLSAKVMGEGDASFLISTTTFMKNGTANLNITFKPKKAGTFTERIEFKSVEVEAFYLQISGTATEAGAEGDVEGDKLPLSTENPQKLVNETFESVVKNKPFSIEGWKNVATTGTRAWWGYDFITNDILVNKVAKITAYDSKVLSGNETPCEMMLVTPALDFKNSESKMFTFRVMGNLLLDSQTDKLELCYIDMADGEMYVEPVAGFDMPYLKDQNEEWMEFHFDLSKSELADVFFMGFRFKSMRGIANSATYYIDNVSYGRTDLASIVPSHTQLAFEVVAGLDYETGKIDVTGLNTTAPITVSVGGANKSKFKASETTLPAAGGSFTVGFNSTTIGIHEAYVKLSSTGAADVYIPITVKNNDPVGTGLNKADVISSVTVFDIAGRIVLHKEESTTMKEISTKLLPGTYIVRSTSTLGVNTSKILVP